MSALLGVVMGAFILHLPLHAAYAAGGVVITHETIFGSSQLEGLAERFHQATGIKVRLQPVGGFASNGPPPLRTADVLTVTNMLVPFGDYLDLTPFLERSLRLRSDDFLPHAWVVLTAPKDHPDAGAIIGIPIAMRVLSLGARKSSFAAAGLSLPDDAAWTWSELDVLAGKLTVDRTGDGYPERAGFWTTPLTDPWEVFVYQAGGKTYDRWFDPTLFEIMGPRSMLGLRFYLGLYRRNGDQGVPRPPPEELAMCFADTWLGRIGCPTDSLLQLPSGLESNLSFVYVEGLALNRDTRHPQAAWEWIEFVAANYPFPVSPSGDVGSTFPAKRDILQSYLERLPVWMKDFIARVSSNPHNIPGPFFPHEFAVRNRMSLYLNSMAVKGMPLADGASYLAKYVTETLEKERKRLGISH